MWRGFDGTVGVGSDGASCRKPMPMALVRVALECVGALFSNKTELAACNGGHFHRRPVPL